MSQVEDHLWGIILAGGNGNRLKGFLKQLYNTNRPKQYCTITGTRSMLRHTLDRARCLIAKDHLLTVVNCDHLTYLDGQLNDQPPGTIIEQPCYRETGPSILLPLLNIHRRDPQALIVIFPSDHFIIEESRFMEYVREAGFFVNRTPESVVLLGIQPDRPETGYGWIERGGKIPWVGNNDFYHVRRFWEKPKVKMAEILQMKGCLWNTMVLVGTANTLLQHFQTLTPDLFQLCRIVRATLGSLHEKEIMRGAYSVMPSLNFSSSILERIPRHLCVLHLTGIYWNDWGEEDRVRLDMETFHLKPVTMTGSSIVY